MAPCLKSSHVRHGSRSAGRFVLHCFFLLGSLYRCGSLRSAKIEGHRVRRLIALKVKGISKSQASKQ
jgi:hypothetical protein